MARIPTCAAAAILCAAGMAALAAQAPVRDRKPGEAASGTAAIRGVVVAAGSGTPLRRVSIRAFSTSGGANGMAQTDEQGRFEIVGLPAGRYIVSAQRSGYVTMQFGQRTPSQPGMPIALEDGQSADKVHFALVRGGAITGRVVDEYGEPISSAQVSAQRFAYTPAGRRLNQASGEGASDRTNDLGEFRLFGLTPGEYYVTAVVRSMDFVPPNAVGAAASQDGYAPTYYPGTQTQSEARRLTVRAGQDTPNANIGLTTARLGRISGRVTSSAGAPLSGAMLSVAPRPPEFGFPGLMASGAPIRPDGTFQTAGLPPGTYTLSIQPMGDRTDPIAEVARVDVTVAGADVTDVFIVTGPGGVVRGRVVTDDGTVPAFRPEQMRVFAVADDPAMPFRGMRPTAVRPDWTFEVTGLTDRVRLQWSVEGGEWQVRHAWYENADLIDRGVDVPPGRVVDGVEVVLTNKVTELAGTITDDRGQLVTDVSVVVFPESRDLWTFNSRYIRMARPDTTGRYTMRLTPAEGYRAIAVTGLESGQQFDPDFLAQALEAATAFDIAEGEAKTLNLGVR